MSASLFVIHESLQNLENLRAELLAQEPLDTEAIASTEAAICEWLTADAVKVTSYVGLIQKRGFDAVAAKSMKEYWARIEKQAEADVERLKANSLAVMQRFEVKELRATPGGGLRRQGNGGQQALECVPIEQMPREFVTATVTVPLATWEEIVQRGKEGLIAQRVVYTGVLLGCDTERIREALKQRVTCQDCKGKGAVVPFGSQTDQVKCGRCEGSGTIQAAIPGCKLMERGEHVRVI